MEATQSDQSRFSVWYSLAPTLALPTFASFVWAALSGPHPESSHHHDHHRAFHASPAHVIAICIGFAQAVLVCVYWTLQSRVARSEELGLLRLLLPQSVYGLAAIATLVSLLAACSTTSSKVSKVPTGGLVWRHERAGSTFARSAIVLVLPWFAPLLLVTGPASPVVFLSLAAHPLALAYIVHRIAVLLTSEHTLREIKQVAAKRECHDRREQSENESKNKVDAYIYASNGNEATKQDRVREVLDEVLLLAVFCWPVLASVYFHGSGHESTFNKLQYTAPYVGFDVFNWSRCGAMLALNTFGPHLYMTLMFPIVPAIIGSVPVSLVS
jgi:hypothetical protein